MLLSREVIVMPPGPDMWGSINVNCLKDWVYWAWMDERLQRHMYPRRNAVVFQDKFPKSAVGILDIRLTQARDLGQINCIQSPDAFAMFYIHPVPGLIRRSTTIVSACNALSLKICYLAAPVLKNVYSWNFFPWWHDDCRYDDLLHSYILTKFWCFFMVFHIFSLETEICGMLNLLGYLH